MAYLLHNLWISFSIFGGKHPPHIVEKGKSHRLWANSLCDLTGSRRFLCVEVKKYISDAPVEHKQLYAQLKDELLRGERDFLNKEEEKELQQSNKRFYRQSLLDDVFFSCYGIPGNGEKGRWFTAAEMFRVMTQRNPAALRGISAQQLSRRLSGLGVKFKHTNHGNYYQVQVL